MKNSVMQIINKWDPIDLFPMAPKDEYVREIERIEHIIRKNPSISVKELAFEIHSIFISRFGSDVYVHDVNCCEKIAEMILSKNIKSR